MAALTENRNDATKDMDLMSGEEIARVINDEDKKVATAVEAFLPEIGRAIEVIAEAFAKGGRLGYFGAGTSGRIGILDAAECPPTFGVEPSMVQAFIAGGEQAVRFSVENAEDKALLAREDMAAFDAGKNDVVVAISASGNPDYIVEVLKDGKKRGAKTIAVTSNPDARAKMFADIFISPVVGPEALTGSSRMKSGTAQKMVLNMLTTGAMVRIGKVYENYMVDVNVSNIKLHDRACRIISEITGLPGKKVRLYLEKSGRRVKTACVMAMKDCSKEEAEQLLNEHKGFLRKVLQVEK